jgi:hypothetical protein
LVPDVSLSYLTAYGKINDKSAIGGSLRYFSLGEIQFTDITGNSMGNFNPNELAADLAYSQKLSDNFAVGIAFRYIYSNLAGGATGSLPYQSATDTTAFLTAGTNGQVLSLTGGIPSWTNASTGTVTSVSGTGTVSGISLSGTVTTTGNLTLGGTLDLSSPPAIGGTTANTVRGTTITATTKFVSSYFDASGSGGGYCA